MAIAFRSVSTRAKFDVGASGGSTFLQLPPGHASGDFLLMFVIADANSGLTATPSGWTLLVNAAPSPAAQSPYNAPPRLSVYTRVDDGSLGVSVPVTFDTSPWPDGNPWVLAFTAAYSGVDPGAPIEQWWWSTTTSTTAAQAHHVLTTSTANDWVLTFRASSAADTATYTCSVGADVERLDDSALSELSCALYDSGAGVSAGTQTARTTTASRACDYGSVMLSIALKAPTGSGATNAVPGDAEATALAYSPTVAAVNGPWDLCGGGRPVYGCSIDWGGTGTGTDVTGDLVSDIAVSYGRDQERQLAPAAVGTASFTLNNTDRTYSPENSGSPFFGDLEPARTMQAGVTWNGQTYPLFTGRIDDYSVKADFADRTVDLSFLDGLSDLSAAPLSTPVYASLRTGDLINIVLDAAGWTGGRDIDPGATVVGYWWADGTDAFSAISDLVKSEGPPAIAYAAPGGVFVFRDRHHRMLRQQSRSEQAFFHAGVLGECTGQGVPAGALSLARPFTYAHGWKDIFNSVTIDVPVRAPATDLQQVWQDTTTYTLAIGESLELTASGSDPFVDAVTPVVGTDVIASGAGVLSVLLSRTSGASAKITLQAVGGPVTVTSVQLQARPVVVQQTVRVSLRDPGSISRHGERAYPDGAPWAGPQDARAIASSVLLHYAERRPTVQIRVVSSDPAHFAQVLSRTVSDRVRIANDELGLDSDFFVERVTHTVQRTGQEGRPPVHAVVLGCEKDLDTPANPFAFDVRGAGFDQGVFDPVQADDAGAVFIFDDPVQGVFDVGEFGT